MKRRPPPPPDGAALMEDKPLPAPDEPTPGIADADALFRDVVPAGPASPPPSAPDDSGGTLYEVAEEIESPDETPIPPADSAPESSGSKTKTKAPRGLDPSDAVEQVWSRAAEWGGSIALLAAAALILFLVFYLVVSSEHYGLAFLVLIMAG